MGDEVVKGSGLSRREGTPVGDLKERVMNGVLRIDDGMLDIPDPYGQEINKKHNARLNPGVGYVVPYDGKGWERLKMLYRMIEESPTRAACFESICGGVLGTGPIATNNESYDRDSIPVADKFGMDILVDILADCDPSFQELDLYEWSEAGIQGLNADGNIYFLITATPVAFGVYECNVETPDAREVGPLWTESGSPTEAVVSSLLLDEFSNDENARVVSYWPEVDEDEDGVRRTLIHLKRRAPGRRFSGLPRSRTSLRYQYAEAQYGAYLNKGIGNGFTGAIFVEVTGEANQGDSPRIGPDGEPIKGEAQKLQSHFENKVTNKGEGRRVITRVRTFDDKPAFIHEFNAETTGSDEAIRSETAREQIITTEGWHRLLLGIPTKGKLGGSGEYSEAYKNAYFSRLRPDAALCGRAIEKVIHALGVLTDTDTESWLDNYSIDFGAKFRQYLEITDQNIEVKEKEVTPVEEE
jgi:hypothetical protein